MIGLYQPHASREMAYKRPRTRVQEANFGRYTGPWRYRHGRNMGSIYGDTPKFKDQADTLTVTAAERDGADSTPTITPVSVASGPTGRNNMCIAVESIYIKGKAFLSEDAFIDIATSYAADSMSAVRCKVIVILDRQPNKAAISVENIWETNDFDS